MEKRVDSPTRCSDCGRGIEAGEKVWIEKRKGSPDHISCATCFWGEDPSKIEDDRIGRIIDNVHHLNERITKLEEGAEKVSAKTAASREMASRLQGLEDQIVEIKRQMRSMLSLLKDLTRKPPVKSVSDELLEMRRRGI